MGRGLGRIQSKIIQKLKNRRPTLDLIKHINGHKCEYTDYHDVQSLAHEIMHDFEVWDNYAYRALTESEIQSFWRALRTLEKRGLIESQTFNAGWDRPRGGPPRGGRSHKKAIRLVHSINGMNSTHSKEAALGD